MTPDELQARQKRIAKAIEALEPYVIKAFTENESGWLDNRAMDAVKTAVRTYYYGYRGNKGQPIEKIRGLTKPEFQVALAYAVRQATDDPTVKARLLANAQARKAEMAKKTVSVWATKAMQRMNQQKRPAMAKPLPEPSVTAVGKAQPLPLSLQKPRKARKQRVRIIFTR